MKKYILILVAAAATAFTVFDVFNELSITEEKGKELLLTSIAEGWMSTNFEINQKARALSSESKVEAIRQLINFAKEYSKTDAFKSDYKKWRKNKLNPGEKTKLGLPKLGKMLDNKINNSVDKGDNEKRYPSDPNELIRQRLTDFLKISATVDFDAELTDARQFKNKEYEHKGSQWKYCYRAGREVVTAAREEAQKWLDELGK